MKYLIESQLHHHLVEIKLGTGRLEIARKPLSFISGSIYMEPDTQEQRICLSLLSRPEARLIRSATRPFALIHLDSPLIAGNIPITQLKVFLLSTTLKGQLIDVVISPQNDKLDTLLRMKF